MHPIRFLPARRRLLAAATGAAFGLAASAGAQAHSGALVQVSRLGNPLVNEAVIDLARKDAFNGIEPTSDAVALDRVTDPEVPKLLKAIFNVDSPPAPRTDLVTIFLTGIPGQFGHPSVDAAVDKIARAARNAGKHWASTTGSVEQARQMADRGARLVFHGADVIFVKNGLEAMRASFAEKLGITFGDASSKSGRSSEYSR